MDIVTTALSQQYRYSLLSWQLDEVLRSPPRSMATGVVFIMNDSCNVCNENDSCNIHDIFIYCFAPLLFLGSYLS